MNYLFPFLSDLSNVDSNEVHTGRDGVKADADDSVDVPETDCANRFVSNLSYELS